MTTKAKLRTCLLIDDDQTDQMLYRRIIARAGVFSNVLSFSYAEDALAFLGSPENRDVDAIFLDINLPRLNGFEFLDRIAAEMGDVLHDAVVVMLSTSPNPQDQQRADQYDVVKEYFMKPLTVEHLNRVVEICQDRA